MSYIEVADRQQGWLLPERLEDYVSAENPVRFLDAFVDSLDLAALGFQRATPNDTGRPPYQPGDLLRLYLYGYLNRLRSSRRLEREAQRNVELLWLLRQLRPDFKTIADFRKDNLQPLRSVCREFTLLCRKLELFGGELVAIDGSKFRAVNSKRRNFSATKLHATLAEIDVKIDGYLQQLDAANAGPRPKTNSAACCQSRVHGGRCTCLRCSPDCAAAKSKPWCGVMSSSTRPDRPSKSGPRLPRTTRGGHLASRRSGRSAERHPPQRGGGR